jgi:hypothetical protein
MSDMGPMPGMSGLGGCGGAGELAPGDPRLPPGYPVAGLSWHLGGLTVASPCGGRVPGTAPWPGTGPWARVTVV